MPAASLPARHRSARPSALPILLALGIPVALVGLAVAMEQSTYDIWGAFWVGPALLLISVPILLRLARREGDPYLFRLLMAAAALKVVGGAIARYWMAVDLYGGTADSSRYDYFGKLLAPLFRSGNYEDLGEISGTRFMEVLTGQIYALIGPTRLGGFMVFSWMAFLGLVFFYKAFRVAFPDGDARRYRLLLFFFPTLVFWPSSIGKEAWMLLCMGAAVYGIAAISAGKLRGLVWASLGLWGAAVVRPHVALLIVIGALVSVPVRVWSRPLAQGVVRHRGAGAVLLAFVVLASVVLVGRAEDFFDLDSLDQESTQEVLTHVEGQTAKGGSTFDAPSGTNPVGYIGATATVLFRPFPLEAHNAQSLVTSIEGLIMFGVILCSLRRLSRLPLNLLRVPFVAAAFVYVAGFIYAFSSIENFGILARQRAQLLPFLFVIVAGISANSHRRHEDAFALNTRRVEEPRCEGDARMSSTNWR